MKNTELQMALASKVEPVSLTLPPGFTAVIDCLLNIEPRTTTPHFSEVAISPSGVVLGCQPEGIGRSWSTVLVKDEATGMFTNFTSFKLIDNILILCYLCDVDPKERLYLLECVRHMAEYGKTLSL